MRRVTWKHTVLVLIVGPVALGPASAQSPRAAASSHQVFEFTEHATRVQHSVNMWFGDRRRSAERKEALAAVQALNRESQALFGTEMPSPYWSCIGLSTELSLYVSALDRPANEPTRNLDMARSAYEAGRAFERCLALSIELRRTGE